MPATRSEIKRDVKVEQLVECAQRLFLERGYDATTMAAIAAEAGIKSNVVYWYFESKDHLFVAAMESLAEAAIANAEAASTRLDGTRDLQAGLFAMVDSIEAERGLIAALHDRARHSPVIAEFHDRIHVRFAEALDTELARCGLPVAERRLVTAVLLAVMESIPMHKTSRPEARKMIRFVLAKLL